jgi:predicted Zn-dependent protease with MMP-like domain
MPASHKDWAALQPPSLSDIERLAATSFAELPETFLQMCEGIVIQVEDFPDDEILDEMDCETEFDLLGLFRGNGLAQSGATPATGQEPNMVWLYRRPILDYWAESDEMLGAVITHVLVHEIGHHFGLSDDDMEAIENRAA